MCECACVCIPPKKLGEFMFLQYVFMSPSITFACSKASRFSLQITYIAACCITWHTYTVTGLTWHTRLHDSHDTHMTYIHGYMTHWHAYTFTWLTWHSHDIHTRVHDSLTCIYVYIEMTWHIYTTWHRMLWYAMAYAHNVLLHDMTYTYTYIHTWATKLHNICTFTWNIWRTITWNKWPHVRWHTYKTCCYMT